MNTDLTMFILYVNIGIARSDVHYESNCVRGYNSIIAKQIMTHNECMVTLGEV